jgi:hypothetical protein
MIQRTVIVAMLFGLFLVQPSDAAVRIQDDVADRLGITF